MKKLLIWGAGDQGTVTLECALATQQYSQIDFLEIKERVIAIFLIIVYTVKMK